MCVCVRCVCGVCACVQRLRLSGLLHLQPASSVMGAADDKEKVCVRVCV